jgi:poly(A) polymerase/tRNA nucleotidyltransferase (CCA-adding enzyme)
MSIALPKEVKKIAEVLRENKYQVFLVGGCVRDILLNKKPKDWDLTTEALPEDIQRLFPESFYTNNFGTVGIKSEDQKIGIIEVTTFRKEGEYFDRRRPNQVFFVKNIEEDLGRRDFTINAMALDPFLHRIVDPFCGKVDLKNKLIRAVGNPSDRFREDALRLLRGVRFSAQLDFKIEPLTFRALKKEAQLIKEISEERIGEEFKKIVLSPKPSQGVELLEQAGILCLIIPELAGTIGVKQNRHHVYTVYEHLLKSLEFCPSTKLSVRLAALFHDIAKPQVKRGEGELSTFYNHDLLGARMVEKVLERLKFSQKIIKKTSLLVKNHMFYYEAETVTPASVRRLIRKTGKENIKDLLDLRIADRLGSGCPKAKPYKLRHLEYLVEKVSNDPINVGMLKINGNDLFLAGVEKGPKMGAILDVLLSRVLEDPLLNKKGVLAKEAQKLNNLDLEELKTKSREKIKEKKMEEDRILKDKHWVK